MSGLSRAAANRLTIRPAVGRPAWVRAVGNLVGPGGEAGRQGRTAVAGCGIWQDDGVGGDSDGVNDDGAAFSGDVAADEPGRTQLGFCRVAGRTSAVAG